MEGAETTPTEYVCELLMKDIQLDELPVEAEQVGEYGQEKLSVSNENVEQVNEMEVKNKTLGVAELIKPSPKKVF